MSGPGGLVAGLDAVRGLALLALTLFEHQFAVAVGVLGQVLPEQPAELLGTYGGGAVLPGGGAVAEVRSEFHPHAPRSEEHTSELQSRGHLVCRLLLEKKK